MENQPEEHPFDPDSHEGGPVKSFLEHLEDLRWVLIKTLVAVGVGFLICLIGGNRVVQIITWPLVRAEALKFRGTSWITVMWGTNKVGAFEVSTNLSLPPTLQIDKTNYGKTNIVIGLEPVVAGTNEITFRGRVLTNVTDNLGGIRKGRLINLGPAAGFLVAFQVAIYAGIVLASPFLFYFWGQFIFPALKLTEKRYVYRGLAVGFSLFLTGVAFCYFVMLPLALNASVGYSDWLGFDASSWRAEEYISFSCKFMLGMGLGFEMPVPILVLVKLGIVTADQLAAFRKYMIIICFTLGALLTTPEVITQVMMAIPMLILYEISIFLARRIEKKQREKEAREPFVTSD